jgi:hypothetical protein
MSYKITYTSKWTGEKTTHTYQGHQSGGEGWAKSLADDNNCKAVCEHIADGPYDHSGKVTHILSVGNDE